MKTVGIIPARFASTRFPGKPLAVIFGKPMIQHVYEQSLQANLDEVIVAIDDERIAAVVEKFGGKWMMTSANHTNGTERVAEVAQQIDADVVVNVQGDEPFIQPAQINLLIECFSDAQVQIASLAKHETDSALFQRNSIVKVVVDNQSNALYFSRSPIPFFREQHTVSFLKHIGIYAFRKDTLLNVVQLPPAPLETAEMLEQLRWISNGYKIKIALTQEDSISVDVPEDLELVKMKFGGVR